MGMAERAEHSREIWLPEHGEAVTLLLAAPLDLELGQDVGFHLALEVGEHAILGTATVVRHDTEGHPAIFFTAISDVDRWRLVRAALAFQHSGAG
jgi:hypothetical protein